MNKNYSPIRVAYDDNNPLQNPLTSGIDYVVINPNQNTPIGPIQTPSIERVFLKSENSLPIVPKGKMILNPKQLRFVNFVSINEQKAKAPSTPEHTSL